MVEVQEQTNKERIKELDGIGLRDFIKVYVLKSESQYYLDAPTAFKVGFITAEEFEDIHGDKFFLVERDFIESLKERYTIEQIYVDERNEKKDYEEIPSIDEEGPKLG